MTSRVYWKTLRLVMGSAQRYIQKHQLQLHANLTTEQYNCVVDVLTAITSCLLLLPQDTPIN